MGDNWLQFRIPLRICALQWATRVAPSRSLLFGGTTDGKMRVYDVGRQRKPLMEFEVGSLNPSTSGQSGVTDLVPRPVTSTSIAFIRGVGWSLFVGNNLGVLREFDLRKLPEWTIQCKNRNKGACEMGQEAVRI